MPATRAASPLLPRSHAESQNPSGPRRTKRFVSSVFIRNSEGPRQGVHSNASVLTVKQLDRSGGRTQEESKNASLPLAAWTTDSDETIRHPSVENVWNNFMRPREVPGCTSLVHRDQRPGTSWSPLISSSQLLLGTGFCVGRNHIKPARCI